MPTAAESQRKWEALREEIEDLYRAKELPEVMKTMAEVHGFIAKYVTPPLHASRTLSSGALTSAKHKKL